MRNVNEEVINIEADVSPNPSTGIFHINSNISDYEWAIYQNGKLTIESKYPNDIDLSQYPNGVYQLKLISQKEVLIKQIVKVQ